jgi:hypothetical protein
MIESDPGFLLVMPEVLSLPLLFSVTIRQCCFCYMLYAIAVFFHHTLDTTVQSTSLTVICDQTGQPNALYMIH